MDYKEALENVGTYTLEAMMARMDRIIKRLWIVILLLIVLLVASNCAWLWRHADGNGERILRCPDGSC